MRRIPLLVVTALLVAACDTGDGTELRPPDVPPTLPPLTTDPLTSVALDELPGSDVTDPLAPAATGTAPPTPAGAGDEFELFVPWDDGGPIDPRYGCDGSNASPPITWAGAPDGTIEFAIAFVDETNLSNGRPFIQWVITGLDAARTSLVEDERPVGAREALNFFGDIAYAGPCPAPGDTNTYRLTVYALNQQLELADGTPAAEMLDAIESAALGAASVTGTRMR